VTARPVPQLLLNADMTFQKAAFDQYRTATADYSGNRQLRSPDFAGSYSAEYTLEGPADSSVSMRGEYIYQSERFFDAANPRGAGQFAPAYGLLNARVTYRPPSESWYFAVWGKNLTDKRYARNIAFVPPTGITWPGDPLTFGLEFGTDF
jgi:iron complex outermembrane receptor protein